MHDTRDHHAAWHRREAIRLLDRASRAADKRQADAFRARAAVHSLMAVVSLEESVPSDVPTMVVGWPGR
jgi:hypothetical protein